MKIATFLAWLVGQSVIIYYLWSQPDLLVVAMGVAITGLLIVAVLAK